MWLYALSVLARHVPAYRRNVDLVRQIHSAFVVPGRGVVWKMKEELSGPYPGYGFGALDAFDGYVSYRCLNEQALAGEIADMRLLIDVTVANLAITQDLGLGMMLWLTHFFPAEDWAVTQRRRSLAMLDRMWCETGQIGKYKIMRKMLGACVAFATLVIAPLAAQAADLSRPNYKAPEYIAPLFSWTGFYVGLNGGYGWANSNWTGSGGDFQVSSKGFMGGGTLGYNYQIGLMVLGIEGDVDYMDLNGTVSTAACASCSVKDTWLGTFRGRVGYSFDRWLPYLTAGAAYGNVYMAANGGSATGTKQGWTAGAGIEYAFLNSWSTKLEYLYTDLGTATCAQAACGFATDKSVSFKANMVRVGLNYRF